MIEWKKKNSIWNVESFTWNIEVDAIVFVSISLKGERERENRYFEKRKSSTWEIEF